MSTHQDQNPNQNPTDPEEATRRKVTDTLAAIVYSRRLDFEIDFANRYALEYFGVIRDDHMGDGIEYVHPDDRAATLAAWQASMATGQHYRHEHRLKLADGHYRRFLAEALPLRDEQGKIVKWYGVLTPLDGVPRQRGPRTRPARVDYYPMRDAGGNLQLVEVAAWHDRPDDPSAKYHPCGHWYRVEVVAESVWISPEPEPK
jgi:PAS domain S-box-containing protein